MKRWMFIICSFLLAMVIGGCSNISSEDSQAGQANYASESDAVEEKTVETENKAELTSDPAEQKETETNSQVTNMSDRMVIYTANLSIQVNSYTEAISSIQQELQTNNGYMVSTNSYSVEDESMEGTITVRIPQENFQEFLKTVENESIKVIDESINGQDVTEEYVDLESRLKSKQVVEKRLLEFMEKAEKTEDLLKISNDLAAVQEEIEQIKGRMNYLDNQVSLATITIHIQESKVNVPDLENNDLNTWNETKKQFMETLNFVIRAISSVIVFIVGSIPVLIVLGGILIVIWFILKRKRRQQEAPPENTEE
ncbi:DUF4349 domain-containing protein [Metabacillus halosaccharovorans]|uniref:DUF4349 domain-containing protein n=1 Tax=Metabacillus halosaccharovorans TaxID=930124 RepID=A0ABT3DKG1_9BACI|nr:DUF4349 domain-containing protein [Metabacillus halosaccharovorans]MCV9887477.1 DUF4349 domain-containing protein [Metabacillus halosaccharovorans]